MASVKMSLKLWRMKIKLGVKGAVKAPLQGQGKASLLGLRGQSPQKKIVIIEEIWQLIVRNINAFADTSDSYFQVIKFTNMFMFNDRWFY